MDDRINKYKDDSNQFLITQILMSIAYSLLIILSFFRISRTMSLYYKWQVLISLILVKIISSCKVHTVRLVNCLPFFFGLSPMIQDLTINITIALYLLLGLIFQYIFLDIYKNSLLNFNQNIENFCVLPIKATTRISYTTYFILVMLIPAIYQLSQEDYSQFLLVVYIVEFFNFSLFCITFICSSSLMLRTVELMYSSKTKIAIDKKMKIIIISASFNFALAITSRIVFEMVKPNSHTLR